MCYALGVLFYTFSNVENWVLWINVYIIKLKFDLINLIKHDKGMQIVIVFAHKLEWVCILRTWWFD